MPDDNLMSAEPAGDTPSPTSGGDLASANNGQNSGEPAGNGGDTPPAGESRTTATAPWWQTHSEGFDKSEAMSWRNTASRYNTPQDFAKAHLELRKSHDARVAIPGPDAKPEEWGKVYDRMGRPKEAKDYKWADKYDGFEIDDTDRSYRDGMAPVMHRIGLNQFQVSELEKAQVEQMKVMRDAQIAARQNAPEKARKALKDRGWTGDTMTRNLNVANQAVIQYGGTKAKDIVNITLADGSTLGAHPDFVEMMSRIGNERAEDDREPSAFNGSQRESAQAEIDRIEQEALSKGLFPTSPNWPHKQLDPLYAKVHGSKNRGPQPFSRG